MKADTATLLSDVARIAAHAGQAALHFYGRTAVDYKADDSPLTQADTASHEAIATALRELTPEIPILSEESPEDETRDRKRWPRFWLVDPLDGTKEFIKQTGQFTVNIALISGNEAELGVVHVPVTGVTYSGAAGEGAWVKRPDQDQQPIRTRQANLEKLTVVASKDHAGSRVKAFLERLAGADVASMGSSLKFCMIAEGQADFYPRVVPTMEWDTGAAQCVIEAAGGTVTDLAGNRLLYNKDDLRNPSVMAFGDTAIDWVEFLENDPAALTQLGWQAWVTGAVMLLTLAALIKELASPAQILFGALVLLLVCGVIQPESALVGFSNPAMLTVGALFVVAGAVRKTGALGFLRHLMMPRSSRNIPALARIMLPASFLSCFLNNTPIVAFLTPMVQKWTQRAGTPASKLLIPLSYATILGGMGTLIGTSTNLVVSSLLVQEGHGSFAMFELAWVGVPAAIVGFVYFATVGHRLLPSTEDQTESHTRASRPYQFDLRVPDDSPLVGQSIQKAGLRKLEDAFLAHMHRRGEIIGPVTPNQVVEAGDILTFFGETRRMDRLLRGGELTRVVEAPNGGAAHQPELPLYEAVVSPDSTLVARSLSTADFRDRFQAVVLGIHRAGQRVPGPLGRIPLEAGDLLLIEAGPNFEERWSQSGEFYLVAPLEREPARAPGSKAVQVLVILVAMMTIVALGLMPIISAAFAAAILVVLSGSLAPGDARRSVDLNVLIVIASAFGLGQAIQDTGLATWFAGMLLQWTSGLGVGGALFLIYLSTNLLTEVLTNSVSAVLVFPVGMAVAAGLGLDPRAVAVTIAVAASASFATPIGYQTNLMVMGPGGYRFRDYLRVGVPLNLVVMALALSIIPRVWN